MTWTSAFGRVCGKLLHVIVQAMALARISPNVLTFMGLVINVVAAILFGYGDAENQARLFRYAGLPLQNYPEVFACLGMVVGLYGIIYFEVARVPERGWLLAAVGLIGKVLGPIGLTRLIGSGAWPASTIVLCLTNDLVWWIPFALYLYDAWPAFRRTVVDGA